MRFLSRAGVGMVVAASLLVVAMPASARDVYVGEVPTLRCEPMRGGSITFPIGEQLTSKQLFDAKRWEANDSVYGGHAVVFPHPLSDEVGIQTDLDVTTATRSGDGTLYRIRLILVKDHPSCDVTFRPRPQSSMLAIPSPSPQFIAYPPHVSESPAPTSTPAPLPRDRRRARPPLAIASPEAAPTLAPSYAPTVAPRKTAIADDRELSARTPATSTPFPSPELPTAPPPRRRRMVTPSPEPTFQPTAVPSPTVLFSPAPLATTAPKIAATHRPLAIPRSAPGSQQASLQPIVASAPQGLIGGTLETKCLVRKSMPYGKAQGNAPFRPVDVYSDGENACVILPPGVAVPVTYALVGHNQRDFVNWSFDGGRHMIIVYSVPTSLELFDGDKNVILPPGH